MNRKVRASRRVSASGAPHVVTWTKQTLKKNQCTKEGGYYGRHNYVGLTKKQLVGLEHEIFGSLFDMHGEKNELVF